MVNRQKRILALDVIRGSALFGILIVNMMSFHSPVLYLDPFTRWNSPWDRITYIFIDVFFQASFYPLFSLLFGYSLAIFRERTLNKKLSFTKVVSRRFLFLLFVGFIHAFFIWHGDILMVYAMIGFFSLPFLKMAPKLLLMFGSFLYLIANTLFAFYLAVLDLIQPEPDDISKNNKLANNIVDIYQHGTFGEITHQRFHDWMIEYNPQAIILLFFTVFPLFLVGAGLSKLKVLETVEGYQEKWKKMMVWTFILGCGIKLLPYMVGKIGTIDYLQDVFGGVLQAVSYGCIIVLLLRHNLISRCLIVLADVGKMSLTNYLLQSIFATMTFYGYGLQYFGKVTLLNGSLLASGFFIIQILFSLTWLKRHHYGPFEWVWRSITYMHFPGREKNDKR